jgi:hypothetical protein
LIVKTSLILTVISGFGYSCFLLYLLSNFADKVAWVLLMLLQLLFIFGAYIAFLVRDHTINSINGNFNSERVFGGSAYIMQWYSRWAMVTGIALVIVAVLYFFLIFKNYKHIKTAIQVIDASADFLLDHVRVMIIPFAYFIINLGFSFACIYNMALIISMNQINVR